MTLDEAIQHALEIAADSCGACAENHRQLAAWLTELKDFNDFMLLVKKMRECQTRYFKTRDKAILIESKQLEASVDKFIAENLHSANARMSCTFKQVDFYNGDGSNTWECSNCKKVWQFDEGSPMENNYNFCPHCGEKIRLELYEND